MSRDAAPQQRDDVLVAFSVHGLAASDRPGVASEGTPAQAREVFKKGWLSSLNNVVVGDRPETVTLLLTLSVNPATATTAAATTTPGTPATPSPPSMIRWSTGDRSPSKSSARAAAAATAPTLLYQSEQRPFGEQPVSPALTRSASPSGVPQGAKEGMVGAGKGRAATMAEEGIVHFSVPARVPTRFSAAGGTEEANTGVEGGGGGGAGAAAVFVVELWQVVNRARRVLVASLPLSWEDLVAVPADPRKCGVFSGLRSERYPSSFLAVRRISHTLPQPLSLTPGGVANHAVHRFNPMVTFFTALRRRADTVGPGVEMAPGLAADGGFPVGAEGGTIDDGGVDVGVGIAGAGGSGAVSSSAAGWELVVCQELAVEGKFTFKFGGRMKGMGVKAVAMARIASQASPAAHLRLGTVSTEEKILRQANFFVKVVYEPPAPATAGANPANTGTEGAEQGGFAVAAEADRVVGVTNTEYGSVDPVWGTNANRAACPYNAPRLQHQVSGATRLDIVGDIDVASDVDTGGPSWAREQERPSASATNAAASASLVFNFYVPANDLEGGGGGNLRLHLFQNMFSLKAGIVDAPVGHVTIPLSRSAGSTVQNPEWKNVEVFHDSSSAASSAAGAGAGGGGVGGIGDFLSEWGEQQQQQQPPPQVLVGVSVQARTSSEPRPGSSLFDGAPASSPLRDGGPAAYGSMLGGSGTGAGSGGKDDDGLGTGGRVSLGAGEWTKVEDDSDSDEEVADEGAAAAAAASTTSMHHRLPGSSENLLSKAVSISDCYRWMDLIGGPRRVVDKEALVDLFSIVDYPFPWVEGHARAISDQVDRLARVLDVYTERFEEGANFRSSLLKKEPLLQYVATNLHIQVWSVRDPVTGVDRNYDFVTTGAPAAHALGHGGGGLVTLQDKLQALGLKVMGLKAARKECKDRGGAQAASELEGHTDNLRAALLEFESLSGRVSMRRACVVSQAVSIAATSFCAKLEMMARGTLDVAADPTTGGCDSYQDLAERWTSTGFLLGFEGLLSIQGKEHGMVEDTVSALDMLADYNLQVIPASPVGVATVIAPDGFDLEVGVEGMTIQCIVGDSSLARLPRALWDNNSGGRGGGRSVRIVPVLFTQGIDIQQSMSHAGRDAREKAAFQADINSQNLARLNRYCHRVCPVNRPSASHVHSAVPNLSSGGMPPLPAPRAGRGGRAEGVDDLLGLEEPEVSSGKLETVALGSSPPLRPLRNSVGASVPEWTHPALTELETAVRDDKVAHKNTAILLEAQVAVRRLCGGRVTFCKSGKDRTAMSVTLEEALLLAETTARRRGSSISSNTDSGVAATSAPAVGAAAAAAAACDGWRAAERSGALGDANVLREHGCRLLVAEKNVGRPLYSFNALQRQFIPELYQPPPQTIQDVITSALNRDS
eukprot:g15928.t1